MGWGINIKNVFLARVHKSELEYKKQEHEHSLSSIQNRLIALGSYTGNTYFDGDENIALPEYVSREIPVLLEEYQEIAIELGLIERALCNLDNVEEE